MVLREIADEAQLWIAKGVNGLQSLALFLLCGFGDVLFLSFFFFFFAS